MKTYITRDDDTADLICFRYYGTTAALVVERMIDANPGLSARGPLLPSGVTVQLPEIDTTETKQGVKLWD